MQFNEIVQLSYSPEQLFDMVADVEHYPEFLPGWQSVTIYDKKRNKLFVEQTLGLKQINLKFISIAILQRPYQIHISAINGPFRYFEIDWRFNRLLQDRTRMCLSIQIDMHSGPESILMGKIMGQSSHSLMQYFKRRAHKMHESTAMILGEQ